MQKSSNSNKYISPLPTTVHDHLHTLYYLHHSGITNFPRQRSSSVLPGSLPSQLLLCLPQTLAVICKRTIDSAAACYTEPLPDLVPSIDNRTIPWGSPSINNGSSTCCVSLDEVRAGIDAIDAQLLQLLSDRAAFVREATRFKPMHDLVDVPARDQQVIDRAVGGAPAVHLPQTIVRAVFTAIINASVPFELCVFDSFHDGVD
ncbi:unnamed protein product [Cyclocybe aegerita]|uniref:Chorismate mutase domain-containing protein n=1 Tax=Cyclocybe aegerita TaxID=1973307 RepID=A0A8S0X6H1_CYCAE|nr:unnamed protein product [Cyclocybe aegerita]